MYTFNANPGLVLSADTLPTGYPLLGTSLRLVINSSTWCDVNIYFYSKEPPNVFSIHHYFYHNHVQLHKVFLVLSPPSEFNNIFSHYIIL